MATIEDIADIIERNSMPEPNTGCWLWLGFLSGGKYKYAAWGQGKQRVQVTHLALRLRGIEVPKGFDACHTCDTPLCVNPDHLFVGTRKDNMRDARAKGRLVGYGKREFCKQGHPLSGDNLYIDPKWQKRHCRICMRRWGREHDARRRPRKRR